MSEYTVYSGMIGWSNPGWRDDFYPIDMPEDWQLAFYNSQFRCVYLPYETWGKAGEKEITNWLQETREGFVFVLQAASSIDEKATQQAKYFGVRGIFADQIDLLWLDGKPDMRVLAQRMQKSVQSGIPLFLISRDGSMSHMRQVKELMDVLGV